MREVENIVINCVNVLKKLKASISDVKSEPQTSLILLTERISSSY